MLTAQNVSLRYTGRPLFAPLDLHVPGGDVMLLTAPSGAGKSTLLHWLCGTAPAELKATGSISLDGQDITRLPAEQRGIGIIFQDPLLFPHLTVAENLLFGLPRGSSRTSRQHMAESALAEVGLDGMGDRDPMTLSGGQKARVALLRSLLAEPRALLLDEPFSGLDDATRAGFARLVLDRIRTNGLPTILVSHDPRDQEWASLPVMALNPVP